MLSCLGSPSNTRQTFKYYLFQLKTKTKLSLVSQLTFENKVCSPLALRGKRFISELFTKDMSAARTQGLVEQKYKERELYTDLNFHLSLLEIRDLLIPLLTSDNGCNDY